MLPLAGHGCGVEERSSSPRSPSSRWRFTHFDAVAREIPISAATWAIGRVLQRFTSRRRPLDVERGIRVNSQGFLVVLSARMGCLVAQKQGGRFPGVRGVDCVPAAPSYVR